MKAAPFRLSTPRRAAALPVLLALLVGCGGTPTPDTSAPTPSTPLCAPPAQGLGLRSLGVQPVQAPEPNWAAPHVPGEVLILSGGRLSAQAVQALSGVQVQVLDAGLSVAQTPTGEEDAAFARRLAAAGLRVQPNFLYSSLALPNDPGYPGNRGIRVDGRIHHQNYLTRIRAAEAWATLEQAGKSKNGVLTAVLDTGVDASHVDLQGRLLPGCTFDNDGGYAQGAEEVAAGSSQGRGHGTSSAGLIGASTDNGAGLSGVTWQGRNILPLKIINEAGASTTSLRNGISYAVSQGAKVINLSLGIVGDPGDQVLTNTITAASRSAVLVAAAGNHSDYGIYFPASHPAVIAVGAVGREDSLACYSARPGKESGDRQLDIVAPGGNAGTTATVTTATPGCLLPNPYDLLTLTTSEQGTQGYALRAGTSEAAPLVSGVASLMWGANPSLNAAQVKGRLLASTRKVNGLNMLDAQAAVAAALK